MGRLVLVLVPAGIAWTLVRDDPEVVTRWLRSYPVVAIVVAVVSTAVGAWAAAHFGSLMRVLQRTPADSERDWEYAVLTHPVGAEAGWAVLYGAGYLVIAGVTAARTVPGTDAPLWQHALVAAAVLLGLVLTLVLPLVAPHRALRSVEEREAVRDRDVARFTVESPGGADPTATARRAYAHDLVNRGVAFRWLVSDAVGQDGLAPSLSKRGRRLLTTLDKGREARAEGAARAGHAVGLGLGVAGTGRGGRHGDERGVGRRPVEAAQPPVEASQPGATSAQPGVTSAQPAAEATQEPPAADSRR